MCIIAIKPQGKKMFDDNTIKTMYINNPDGAGYMFYDKGTKKVIIKKGFLTCSSLLESLHAKNLTDTNVVLHFRIGTSGLNDKLNCHPYPIGMNNATKCSCDLGMAHNGILSNFNPPKDSKINDTQTFINEVLNKLKKGFLYDDDKMILIKKIIGMNKLAFLTDKNQIITLGNFISDDGYIYSNDSYHERTLYPKWDYKYTKGVSGGKSAVTTNTKGVYENKKCVSKTAKTAKKDNKCVSITEKIDDWDYWTVKERNEFWEWWDKNHPVS